MILETRPRRDDGERAATARFRVTNRDARNSLRVLRRLFGREYLRHFGVKFWDGTLLPAHQTQRFAFCLNAPHALRAALTPPLELSPGQTFVDGALDVEGDLESAIDALRRAADGLSGFSQLALLLALKRLPEPPAPNVDGAARLDGVLHSRERDAAAVSFHYDQPVEFYRAFLDPDLVYSCAYFDDGITTLTEAQRAKSDYILRKLRIAPGDSFLDIGCGWGALVIRAAQRGAHALGITLSRRQCEEAQRRIAAAGLGDRAFVELRDYRELGDWRFHKIASVGMVEHVGRERLGEYFQAVSRALLPGGLFLNHGIVDQSPERSGYRAGGFMGRYVFPDGDLLPISDMLEFAERSGFEVRDVENLREHYARTLRAWVANLERNAADAVAAAGERAYRIWRLYMAGSAQGFASGRMGVFQSLLAKPRADGSLDLPATRRGLYS